MWLWLAVLCALAVLALLSPRSFGPESEPAFEAVDRTAPRYELLGADWLRTDADGAPQFVARAAQMTWYDDQSARLQQTEVLSLGGAGSPWRLTAPQGAMAPGSSDLQLKGNVMASGRWPDGAPLGFQTQQLWIDIAQETLHTDQEIALEGPGRRMLATGLRADFDGRQIELLGEVRAQYNAASSFRAADVAATPRATSQTIPDETAPAVAP